MKRTVFFWIISIVITLASVYYQRVTGPTYPLSGKIQFEGKEIKYKLERSHEVVSNQIIELNIEDASVKGRVVWKRYKSTDSLTYTPMNFIENKLRAELPAQPAAGKLQYYIELSKSDTAFLNPVKIPAEEPVVTRFKGVVPLFILIPHIIMMFVSMLLSTRTGFECFNKTPNYKKHTLITFITVAVGGLVLGPLTQLYAFGALWTGFPFGHDLTDNKTLIAFIAWAAALIAVYKSQKPAKWILAAAIITFIIFLIPHSMFGSELKYQ